MFKPLHNNVLIQKIVEEVSKGGIVLVNPSDKESTEGKVIAVGPGKTTDKGVLIPVSVKPGDKVLFCECSGNDIVCDGEKFLIMKEEDIFAVLE